MGSGVRAWPHPPSVRVAARARSAAGRVNLRKFVNGDLLLGERRLCLKGKGGGFLKVYTESLKEWMGWEAFGTNYSFSVVDAWEGFDLKIEFVPEINRFRRGIRLKKVGQANRGWKQQLAWDVWNLWLFGGYAWICGRRVSGKGDFGNWRMAVGEGEGFPPPSPRGQALCGNNGGGMGPRMREDNGGEGGSRTAPTGVRTTEGVWEDGSPHARGQGGEGRQDFSTPLRCARNDMCEVGKEDGDGFPPRREQRREGWVPACARRTGGCPPEGGREGKGGMKVPICWERA